MNPRDVTASMLLLETNGRSDPVPNDLFDEATPLMGTGASILVVEDDSGTLRLERFVLEEAGFEVQEAKSGEEALEALNEYGAALVLLDIGLPGMDGFTACRRIRESHQIPIIIVSAENKSEHIVRGLSLGADDYVTKPFSTTELAARVKAVLRRYNFVLLQARAAESDPASDPRGESPADAGASEDGGPANRSWPRLPPTIYTRARSVW